MTLKHVRPATIHLTKLLAFALLAIGIAVFAYFLADFGALRQSPAASALAWMAGVVLLALEARKCPAETAGATVAPERLSMSHSTATQPPVSSVRDSVRKSRLSANYFSHASCAAGYTHQTSHFESSSAPAIAVLRLASY
jgi:hypothetical protein